MQGIDAALTANEMDRALKLALRLKEPALIWKCVESVSPSDIATVAKAIPTAFLATLFTSFAENLEKSPHLEFMLLWVQVAFCSWIKPFHLIAVRVSLQRLLNLFVWWPAGAVLSSWKGHSVTEQEPVTLVKRLAERYHEIARGLNQSLLHESVPSSILVHCPSSSFCGVSSRT